MLQGGRLVLRDALSFCLNMPEESIWLMRTLKEYEAAPNKRPVTWQELSQLRNHLDEIWKSLGVDITFTHHFFDRVNDPRNKRQITIEELQKLFSDTFRAHGQKIALRVKPGTDTEFEAVLTDLSTKVNLPFVLKWDRHRRELLLVAKTVMRKDNFYTSDPKLTVSHFEPRGNNMKQKTFTDLKAWLSESASMPTYPSTGWGGDEVEPSVDPAASFSVEQPEVLDKLNAYCHEITNHQYINPYFPLNKLWQKLSVIGLNFDLKKLMLTGDHGRVETPLTQWGGRYGILGGPFDHFVGHDDGISNRIPGGLKLVVTFQKTGGVYTITAQIEHGSTSVGFGEDAETEVKKK